MEVHHHPDLHHEQKPWKEYFLEFIMIFIAVTLGFFAESLQEHITDKSKEKESIVSLLQDLKVDQHILSEDTAALQSGINMMDSLVVILNNPSLVAANTGQLYYLARLAPRTQPLSINDRTFQQLKNSGNFALIKNINTSNRIMEYYNQLTLVRLLEQINENEFTQYKELASKIFDAQVFLRSEGQGDKIIRVTGNPPLQTTDENLLRQLSVFAVYMHGTKKGLQNADERIKQTGGKLIQYLQKEYHLE